VLAARLSEEPERRVCLVEAGPDYGPYADGRWPDDVLDGRQLAFSHSWETEREDRSQLRARVIGGCSAHKACVVLEGTAADYDEWGPGWTAADLRPYLDRAREQLLVRRFARDELSPWHGAFADACGEDAILHPVNAVGHVRWNAAFAYLDAVRSRPNPQSSPTRSSTGSSRGACTPIGSTSRRAPHTGARGFSCAAGSATSCLSPRACLDHVGVGFGWQSSELLQMETDSFASTHPVFMAQVTVRAGGGDPFFFPAAGPGGQDGWQISAAVFLMKPRSQGRVRLTSPDPRAPLRIEHGFLSDPRDAEALVEGVEALRALADSQPIRRYATRSSVPVSTSTPRPTSARRPAGSSTPPARVRSGGSWMRAAVSSASTACLSPMPRSCRPSPGRTRT
jgi:choline dehydrogenase